MRLNLMDGKPYFSQRNNEIDALNACFPTAFIQALSCTGHAFPPGDGQPEDSLISFVRDDPGMIQFYTETNRELQRAKTPANQVHQVIVEGVNRWMKEKLVEPNYDVRVEWFKRILDAGKVIVSTGVFPGLKTGHAICITGYQSTVSGVIDYFFVQDPYGDCHTKYQSHKGRDVHLTGEMLESWLKPTRFPKKIAHVVS